MGKTAVWRGAVLIGLALLVFMVVAGQAAPIGYQAVPRDAFPVFDNPSMLSAAEAEARRLIFDRDAVIGVAHGPEAKAYPITIMGVHELGNDVVGGMPIAVSW
jgi:hypothetical protein